MTRSTCQHLTPFNRTKFRVFKHIAVRGQKYHYDYGPKSLATANNLLKAAVMRDEIKFR